MGRMCTRLLRIQAGQETDINIVKWAHKALGYRMNLMSAADNYLFSMPETSHQQLSQTTTYKSSYEKLTNHRRTKQGASSGCRKYVNPNPYKKVCGIQAFRHDNPRLAFEELSARTEPTSLICEWPGCYTIL